MGLTAVVVRPPSRLAPPRVRRQQPRRPPSEHAEDLLAGRDRFDLLLQEQRPVPDQLSEVRAVRGRIREIARYRTASHARGPSCQRCSERSRSATPSAYGPAPAARDGPPSGATSPTRIVRLHYARTDNRAVAARTKAKPSASALCLGRVSGASA